MSLKVGYCVGVSCEAGYWQSGCPVKWGCSLALGPLLGAQHLVGLGLGCSRCCAYTRRSDSSPGPQACWPGTTQATAPWVDSPQGPRWQEHLRLTPDKDAGSWTTAASSSVRTACSPEAAPGWLQPHLTRGTTLGPVRSQCPQHVSQSLGPVHLEARRVTWRLPTPTPRCGPALGAFSDPGGWSKGTPPPVPAHMQD